MTCRLEAAGYIALTDRVDRIGRLSSKVRRGTINRNDPDIIFLKWALRDIFDGCDPLTAFNVKARRGERRRARRCAWKKALVHSSSLAHRLNRICRIACALHDGTDLIRGDTLFLANALGAIACGIRPDIALGSRARRGEKKTASAHLKRINKSYALPWIAAAIDSTATPRSAPPMKLDDALHAAAQAFGLTYETLRKMWTHADPKPGVTFRL